VVVRIGDRFCASGQADNFRHDLRAADIGDGSHGFNIDLTGAHLEEDAAEAVEAHAVSGAESAQLPRSQGRANRAVDLVAGRMMPVADEAQFPLFILGPARSGTSAIALALLRSGHYKGMGEGHLFPMVHALLGTIDNHYERYEESQETLLARVPRQSFQEFIRRGLVQLAKELFPTPYWLDKTPTVEMVRSALLMRELWPNARFIFMKRRVIENVLSRQRKFPHESAEMHYLDWIAVMTAWLDVREQLAETAFELEHRDLVLDPDAAAARISEFLQMPDGSAARFREYLRTNRPEQTDESFGAIYSLDRLDFSDSEKEALVAKCDPLMVALGYSYSSSYYAGPNSGGAP